MCVLLLLLLVVVVVVVVVLPVVVCVMLDPIKFIKQPNKRFSIKRKIQSRRRCQC